MAEVEFFFIFLRLKIAIDVKYTKPGYGSSYYKQTQRRKEKLCQISQ